MGLYQYSALDRIGYLDTYDYRGNSIYYNLVSL